MLFFPYQYETSLYASDISPFVINLNIKYSKAEIIHINKRVHNTFAIKSSEDFMGRLFINNPVAFVIDAKKPYTNTRVSAIFTIKTDEAYSENIFDTSNMLS